MCPRLANTFGDNQRRKYQRYVLGEIRCLPGASKHITERLFLLRKPGVFAYAASAIMEMYSLMMPQRKMAEQSMRFVCIYAVYLSVCELSNSGRVNH